MGILRSVISVQYGALSRCKVEVIIMEQSHRLQLVTHGSSRGILRSSLWVLSLSSTPTQTKVEHKQTKQNKCRIKSNCQMKIVQSQRRWWMLRWWHLLASSDSGRAQCWGGVRAGVHMHVHRRLNSQCCIRKKKAKKHAAGRNKTVPLQKARAASHTHIRYGQDNDGEGRGERIESKVKWGYHAWARTSLAQSSWTSQVCQCDR